MQAALIGWIVLGYVISGAIAWWRRPDSRFGPLMVAAGFTFFLSILSWSNAAVPYTIGIFFDLVPASIYIHVYLAFPSGRLERRIERWVVTLAYAVALGPQLVGLLLGGFGPDDAIAVWDEPDAAYTLLKVQLSILAGLCLAAIVLRRVGGRPPLRRPLAVLVDAFALGLVMIAFLYLSGALGLLDGEERVRAAPPGDVLRHRPGPDRLPRRPALHAPRPLGGRRPARRSARRPERRAPARRPRARPARPDADARLLVARVRELGGPRRPAGHAHRRRRRAGGDDDRQPRRARRRPPARSGAGGRARAARRRHGRRRDRARERPPAGRAARSPGGAARVARADRRSRRRRAAAARAQPARRRAAAAGRRRAAAAAPAHAHPQGPRRRRGAGGRRQRRAQRVAAGAARARPRAAPGGARARARRRAEGARRALARADDGRLRRPGSAPRARRARRLLRRVRVAGERHQVRTARTRSPCACPMPAAAW